MKIRTFNWVWLTGTALGVLAVYLLVSQTGFRAVAVGLTLVWLIVSQTLLNRLTRLRKQALATMWGLADQLNFGPSDVQALAPQYGVADWQASRPDNYRFTPASKAVVAVTTKLQALIDRQTSPAA
ncbi:hypothetical protein [Lacticaseibacillus daqingensis]|uniref:hypothetical protein n=1 Tax=Lacticaseibacillus daqingensis TaxID=2486014 RepID=UPI000F78CAD1|nr:hypothetical protein [Lacticaseibacillus daqingensis]